MIKVESNPRYKETLSIWDGQSLFLAGSERAIIYETTRA
jgi:hypothetical protein